MADACAVCGGGDDEETVLVCELCDTAFHNTLYCAGFVVTADHGDWLCQDCQAIGAAVAAVALGAPPEEAAAAAAAALVAAIGVPPSPVAAAAA